MGAQNHDYKRFALKAAKDFDYGEDTIRQIEECNFDECDKIADIMKNARIKKWGGWLTCGYVYT